jgi:CDP-diacylglycerol--glycerol-3-phosphate 3-phosphatidyltransferase
MGWANRITIGRAGLCLALWVLLAVTTPTPSPAVWWVAFVLFVVTAATDAVDGMIARRLGQVSVFGRIADPLVDKLLVLGTLTMLLGMRGIETVLPAWAVVVILAREVVITALRGAVEGKGLSFQAAPIGKGKMLAQCVATGLVLLWGAGVDAARRTLPGLDGLPGPEGFWCVTGLLVLLATLLTAFSGIDYGVRAVRLLRRS